MHLGKAKNILLAMLLGANLILIGLFAWRQWEHAHALNETNRALIQLLAQRNITVQELPNDSSRIPILLVPRDKASEKLAAQALLGNTELHEPGGEIQALTSETGRAHFQPDGRFEVQIEQVSMQETASQQQQLQLQMGLTGRSSWEQQSQLQDGGRQTLYGQTVNQVPVFNAYSELSYNTEGALERMEGRWLFGATGAAVESDVLCKSAGAILLLFSDTLEGQSLEVLEIHLGYRLHPAAPDIRLVPEWRVVCADREYYLDAFTAIPSVVE